MPSICLTGRTARASRDAARRPRADRPPKSIGRDREGSAVEALAVAPTNGRSDSIATPPTRRGASCRRCDRDRSPKACRSFAAHIADTSLRVITSGCTRPISDSTFSGSGLSKTQIELQQAIDGALAVSAPAGRVAPHRRRPGRKRRRQCRQRRGRPRAARASSSGEVSSGSAATASARPRDARGNAPRNRTPDARCRRSRAPAAATASMVAGKALTPAFAPCAIAPCGVQVRQHCGSFKETRRLAALQHGAAAATGTPSPKSS